MGNLYLTDRQYLDILEKIEQKLKEGSFDYYIYDSNEIGNKYTESNLGFCNEDYTTLDTALFPNQFIEFGYKGMKYKKENQACPFDDRVRTLKNEKGCFNSIGWGCYYTCCLRREGLSKEELLNYISDTKNKFTNGIFDEFNNKYR